MIAACGPAAKKYGVSENIHPDDLLFWSTERISTAISRAAI
jgi:hypothetical protein